MEIKLKHSLREYRYIVMFDLASKNSGVCLWNIATQRPEKTFLLTVHRQDARHEQELYEAIKTCVDGIHLMGIDKTQLLFAREAMPTQLRGGNSTVQTFLALAKAHAILNLFLTQNEYDFYDIIGVYPASTHAFLRQLSGWDNTHKISKDDIKQYVIDNFRMDPDLSYDEYDAVFLAQTLQMVKWNKDIQEAIKEQKRHKKDLKSVHAIERCQEEIDRLELLKI